MRLYKKNLLCTYCRSKAKVWLCPHQEEDMIYGLCNGHIKLFKEIKGDVSQSFDREFVEVMAIMKS